jgi:hypothetical protein
VCFRAHATGQNIECFAGVQVPRISRVSQSALSQHGLGLGLFGHGRYAVFVGSAKIFAHMIRFSSVSFLSVLFINVFMKVDVQFSSQTKVFDLKKVPQ